MLDANDLLKGVKKAAMDAITSSKPTAIIYGIVVSISPVAINIDPKLTLGIEQLILTRNVIDHEREMTIEGEEKRKYKVHNGLKKGEEVILIQAQGGQQFIVLERL